MARCERCSREVSKLVMHAHSGEHICVQCLTQDGIWELASESSLPTWERRGSTRIQFSTPMTIRTAAGLSFPVLSVDISMTGLCFAWTACHDCPPAIARPDITPSCVFFPHYTGNPDALDLEIDILLRSRCVIPLKARLVYILRDTSLDLEYVGAKFMNVPNEYRRALEKLIIRYAT